MSIKEYIGTGVTSLTISMENILVDGTSYDITGIEANAFDTCTKLTQLTIPIFITSIDVDAFVGCEKLKYIVYQGTEQNWNAKFSGVSLTGLVLHTSDCVNGEVSYDTVKDDVITATCSCNKERGTLTLEASDIIYDSKLHEIEPKVAGTVPAYNQDEDVVVYTYPTEDKTVKNAGTYTATLAIAENVVATKEFSISPKTITKENVALTNSAVTYTGSEQLPTITVIDGEKTLKLNTDYTINFKDALDAEDCIDSPDFTSAGTIFVEVAGVGNYTGAVTKEYIVNKAQLTITAVNKSVIKNNLTFMISDVVANGLQDGDVLSEITITPNTDGKEVGENFTLTPSDAVIKNGDSDVTDNYEVSYIAGTLNVTACDGHIGGEATCVDQAICDKCHEGYDGPANHSWEFVASEATITATCQTVGCDFSGTPATITLKENNVVSFEYDGTVKENPVEIVYSEGAQAALGDILSGVSVVYAYDGQSCTVKNAGNYTASVTVGGKTATLPFEITAKPLTGNDVTIMVANESCEYTGSEIEPQVAVILKDGETTLTLGTDYEVEYSNNTDVGTATVRVNFIGNYSGTGTKNFEIVPMVIKAMLYSAGHITYTGNPVKDFIISDILFLGGTENQDPSYELTFKRDNKKTEDFTNAGVITVEVKLTDNNYTFENGTKTTELPFEIVPMIIGEENVEISIAQEDYVYTGSQIRPEVKNVKIVNLDEVSGKGETIGDKELVCDVDYEVIYGENIKADTGTVIVTLRNYIIDNGDESGSNSITKEFTINQKELRIGTISVSDREYNGKNDITIENIELIGIKETDDVKLTGITASVADGNASEEKKQVVFDTTNAKLEGKSSENYKLPENFTLPETQVTISKTTVIITAPKANTLTCNGAEQPLVTAGSTTFGEIEYSLDEKNWNTTIPTATEKGEYTVYYRVQGTENYDGANGSVEVTIEEHKHDWKFEASDAIITATCQNTVGCDINKTIKLEVKAPENLVYDGEKKEVTYTITEGYKEVFGDEITVSYIGDKIEQGKCINKGDYTAVVKAQGKNATLDFSITPRTIIITDIEGLERVYDGTTKVDLSTATKVVYTNGIDGKPIEFDLSKVTATATKADVGDAVLVTLVGDVTVKGDENSNYQCSVLDDNRITVKITPATVTITPNAKSSEQYYNLPALDYEVTGLIGKDELTKAPTLTTTADIKTVGNYTITASGAEASANYTITYAPATLTITEHKNHIVKDGTWKETVHGTCMVVGKEAGTCTLCSGTVTRDSKTDPNNHKLITKVIKHETCTQDGEALVTCANGCSYSLKTALPADGESHSFAKDFTVIESTCVAKGSKYKVCQNPNCKVVSERTEIAINPDAHKNIVTINVKEATCEVKGYTGDKVCNDCKKTTEPGMEINAKGHTESDWIIDKEATFTEEGAKHTACTVCKKELKKEVIAKRALETPEVKIENVSNGIKVSWSQDGDATGYTVYSSTYNAKTKKWSAWKNRGTAAATKSSWTDKVVTEGVTYRYTVRSVNGTNRSAYKATQGLRYVSTPKVTVSITSTGLLAKWDKVNSANSYIVYRAELNADGKWSSWTKLGTTASAKNTWSDTKVQSGVTYKYTVRAVVGKVKGGYTASSSIIYLAQPILKIENAANGITGKWASIAGATGYTIYRSEYNTSTKKWSSWLNLGTTKATAKSFTDKTAKSGVTYKYTIRAINGKLKSTYQDSNKLVYLAQPTLTISNVANGIQGKWNQVNGATGYIIYRSELKDGKWTSWTNLGTTKATTKSFTDKTAKSGVTYKYTIRAKNGNYKSSYVASNQSVFLSVPTVKITNAEKGVKVTWNKIEGATNYIIYRAEYNTSTKKWTSWKSLKTIDTTSFVDESVVSNVKYKYTVRALSGESRGYYKSSAELLYLATPTVVAEKNDGVIKVSWTKTEGATSYVIYRSELSADGKWSKWARLGTASEKYTSCKDKTVKEDATYKYTVRAVNGNAMSSYVASEQILNGVVESTPEEPKTDVVA